MQGDRQLVGVKPAAIVASLAVLSACHGNTGNPRQMEALNGCTQRWRIEYPDLYGEANEATRRRALAVMMPDQITFDGDGFFDFEQPHSRWRESSDMQFVCRGNIERRTIEFVGHGDTLRRPGAGIVWSF